MTDYLVTGLDRLIDEIERRRATEVVRQRVAASEGCGCKKERVQGAIALGAILAGIGVGGAALLAGILRADHPAIAQKITDWMDAMTQGVRDLVNPAESVLNPANWQVTSLEAEVIEKAKAEMTGTYNPALSMWDPNVDAQNAARWANDREWEGAEQEEGGVKLIGPAWVQTAYDRVQHILRSPKPDCSNLDWAIAMLETILENLGIYYYESEIYHDVQYDREFEMRWDDQTEMIEGDHEEAIAKRRRHCGPPSNRMTPA